MIANMLTSIIKCCFIIPYGAFVVWLIYGVNVFTLGWIIAMYTVLLLCIGWTIGFLGACIILRWGRQAQSTPWMIAFFFIPFCAVYYPIATLPSVIQKISLCIPITHIFETARNHVLTGIIDWKHLAIGSVLTFVYLGLSMLLFRQLFIRALQRGLASLE